jgi:protein MAK11
MASTKKRSHTNDDDSLPVTKKQLVESKSSIDALLSSSSLQQAEGDEDFRVITGTYERILYGINAYWAPTNDKKQQDKVK